VTKGLLWLAVAALVRAQDAGALAARAGKLAAEEKFTEAVPLLERALKLEPTNSEVRYRLGYAQFRLKQYPAARGHFLAVVRAAPPAHYSRYFLGRIALAENKPAEAVTWLEPVRVMDSASQLAAAYAAAGQPLKAVPLLSTALGAEPWDSNLHYRLGRLRQQLGQAELARESLETAARLKDANREDVEILIAVAKAIEGRRAEEARALGEKIAARAQPEPDSLVALGVLFGGAGLEGDAVRIFAAAVERKPEHFQAQHNLGLALLRGGRTQQALPALREAVRLLPQSVEANLAHGLAAVMNQQYGEAVPSLERVWQAGDVSPRAASLYATALLRTGEAARAAAILKTAAAGAGADLNTHLLRLEALNASHDSAGALEAALEAARAFPAEPRAAMAAAQQLARAGRYREAQPQFERVTARDAANVEAALGLGDCLQKTGQHEAALPRYRAAMNGQGTSLAARLGLARSLVALRRLAESRDVIEEALRLHPDDAALKIEQARVRARLAAAP